MFSNVGKNMWWKHMLLGGQPPRWPPAMLTDWIHALPTWNQDWPCMTHRPEQKWWCVISKAKPQKASKLSPWSSGSPTLHSAICRAVRVLKQHVERPHRQGLTCQSREGATLEADPQPQSGFQDHCSPDQKLTATSWENQSQDHPAQSLSNSWCLETWRDKELLPLF